MTSFSIAVDIGHLLPDGSPLARDAFPTLASAVRQIAEAAQRQWVAYAAGAAMPSGKTITNRTGEYMRSILVRDTGEFAAEAYSELPYARVIEEGAPECDLKKMLSSSLKVRLAKDGRRYLIIPFRHDHPGSVMGNNMSAPVWNWWQQGRVASSIAGTYRRLSGTGAFDVKTRKPLHVPGRTYSWGDRLGRSDLAAMGVTGEAARRQADMVMFRRPGGKGQGAHTQYISFRVMMEGAPGWIAPARAGLFPARTVADQLKPIAEEAFQKAVEADLAKMIGGS